MKLPDKFLNTMREMLGEEYSDYMCSMEQPSYAALRVNTHKISPDRFCEISPFALEQVDWTAKGFYYDRKQDNPSRHPYYYAGLYYIQEPSAMIPASLMPVQEGDFVLDLCAAPGGKATELAAKLDGTGLLVANDISVSRAMALAKNLQLTGVGNVVVTAETPERIAEVLPEFFDKILVDAPCSGEGMFRREPKMIKDWLEQGPEYYAELQRQILSESYRLLKPGGYMVYSTCTFSPLEDEGMIQWFLQEYEDMKICPVQWQEGFSEGRPDWIDGGDESLQHCVRIFPHRAKGEGHFAVLLHKKECMKGTDRKAVQTSMSKKHHSAKKHSRSGRQKDVLPDMWRFLKEREDGVLSQNKDTIFLKMPQMDLLAGLRTIYAGLILGSMHGERFEPSQQLALAMETSGDDSCSYGGISTQLPVFYLTAGDERVVRYLKGETLQTERNFRGDILLCVDGYPLGWCRGNGTGMLKNKYYPGWRMV